MVSLAPALLPVAALVLGASAISAPSPGAATTSSPRGLAAPASAHTPPATPTAVGRATGAERVPRQGWQWPLDPTPFVTRRFQRPASTWGAGHRGVDLAARPGQPVLAAAAGQVVHVGVVAGRGTISVLHAGGVRTTYEPVAPRVRRGQVVQAGEVIGVVDGVVDGGVDGVVDGAMTAHCSGCLHLGALRGRLYLDPLALLRPGHVVLLPVGNG